jgi:TfoX/Sxy family transcriptional regulator of competence genes
MAFDEGLAQRIRELTASDPAVTEKRMFGGLAFLWNGHMFTGVSGTDALMVRVGKPNYAASLARAHVREMDFTGRPLQGYVYVDQEGLLTDEQLSYWINLGREFVASLPVKVIQPKPRNR